MYWIYSKTNVEVPIVVWFIHIYLSFIKTHAILLKYSPGTNQY